MVFESYSEYREREIKKELAELRAELENKEKQLEGVFHRTKKETVTRGVWDRDIGGTVPQEVIANVPLTKEERDNVYERIQSDIYSIKSKIHLLSDELWKIEYDKPENVKKREMELERKNIESLKKDLEDRKNEHVKKYSLEELNKLIKYLRMADYDDLADAVLLMRFAHRVPNSKKTGFLKDEISLELDERKVMGFTTTKTEAKQITKSKVRLVKRMTKLAKKYRAVYLLCSEAYQIVWDMEKKGIRLTDRHNIRKYFQNPMFKYYDRQGKLQNETSIGNQYLDFYIGNHDIQEEIKLKF